MISSRLNQTSGSGQHSRRDFLKSAGAACALGILPWHRAWALDRFDVVSIFHSTDLHGNIVPTSTYDGTGNLGGLARVATRIGLWRQESPHHLVIDLGDVYQGTAVGFETQGKVMIDAFNHIGYDAWVLGNHEFDWGVDAVRDAVKGSRMPVLAANSILDGVDVAALEGGRPGEVCPFLLREINGYTIAVIGAITPGMPNWFLSEAIKGFETVEPAKAVSALAKSLRAAGADAVVLGTHMGIRQWGPEDDAANRIDSLTRDVPGIDLVLGGHTHQDFPSSLVNSVPYSQALYFGIRAGRADLIFDRETRRLVRVEPYTVVMDSGIEQDPAVLALARDSLERAEEVMTASVGTLRDSLGIDGAPGRPSDSERLICTAILEGLGSRGERVDAAVHGLLYQDAPIEPGPKTVADMWGIIPFENFTVVAELDPEHLTAVLEEVFGGRGTRSIVGIHPVVEGRGANRRVTALTTLDGMAIPRGRKLRIAFNSYDAASGGARFPKTREILGLPGSRRRLLPYQTRALLIDFFKKRTSVGLDDLIG